MCLAKGTKGFKRSIKRKKCGFKAELTKYYGSRKKESSVMRMKPEEPKSQLCIEETHSSQNQTHNLIQNTAHQGNTMGLRVTVYFNIVC